MADIFLPEYVNLAINILENNGYSAYAVGGCIRDYLLGREANDYDICTDALPNETSNLFSSYHVIETGIKHGTVTVRIDNHPIEITTFRKDGDYSDGRHPDSVNFTTDIVSDLSRRDFTINAMAYSLKHGLIDPFEGQKDLKTRTIRCVGDPHKRFSEDALRIIRAIRFASVLNFDIEKQTSDAIFELKDRLDIVSRERVREEFFKLICGNGMINIFLNYEPVITQIIPELKPAVNYDQNNPHHEYSLFKHLVLTASQLDADPVLRLAGLLHDVEKPSCQSLDDFNISHFYSHAAKSAESAKKIATNLKCSNAEAHRIELTIKYHDGVIDENEKALKRRLNQLGESGLFDLLNLQRADNLAQKSQLPTDRLSHNDNLRVIARKLIAEKACVNTNTLAVNGNHIKDLGFKGRQIGKALSILLDAVINGDIENKEKALLDFVNINKDKIMQIKP